MSTAADLPILSFQTPDQWDAWLAENGEDSPGIWIRMFKKKTTITSIDHAGALEVALCYGWIDGQARSYDDESWLQKFTPRGPRSTWSRVNTQHIERLTAAGRMKPAGLARVDAAKADGRWARAYESPSKATLPDDFLQAVDRSQQARAFLATLNKQNTYAIYHRLQTAKKAETRQKRITAIVEMLARGERFYP